MKKSKQVVDGCTSTASSGALKCALERRHTTSHATVKAAQHATWTTEPDGRIKVITYSHKKKMSEWFEDAPKSEKTDDEIQREINDEHEERVQRELANPSGADKRFSAGEQVQLPVASREATARKKQAKKVTAGGLCGIPRKGSADTCGRDPGHTGPHRAMSGAHRTEWGNDDATSKCGVIGHGFRCVLATNHSGEHRSELVPGGSTAKWSTNADGSEQGEIRAVGEVGNVLSAVATGSGGWAKPARVTTALARIGTHEIHPAAALFPMIAESEWPSFVADIGANGQRKPIVRIGDLILDGRNRLRACLEIGIEPRFRAFGEEPSDGADPIAFVVSENIHRRHLNETQRAFVGAELVPMYEAQARERMLAGKKDPTLNSGQGRAPSSAELAARAVNVGKASIEAALVVKRDADPQVLAAAKDRGQLKVSAAAELSTLPKKQQREIVAKVGGGEMRAGKVRSLVRQEKKREIVRSINERGVDEMPAGPFGVIYGDYPWWYDNSDEHEGSRGHAGYPQMTMDQIFAHARETRTRAAKDCLVVLWVTNLYIAQIGRVVEEYGAEHRTMLTWPKPRAGVGSWPRGQTEHLVIASIGEPVHTLNEVTTLLAPYELREHSRKPDEVADLLRKHCSGPFLELFGRGDREGWAVWGAESQKFATEAA